MTITFTDQTCAVTCRNAEDRGHDGGITLLPCHKGGKGGSGAFYNSVTGNFMVYQERYETFLMHLFAHPEY